MGFKSLKELHAYRAARALKLEVYRLVKAHRAAFEDHRYRSQLFEAAASVEMNIAEGFRRYSAGEFSRFLRIARGSTGETAGWLQDGIDREYFTKEACARAFELTGLTGRLTTGLIVSLRPFAGSHPIRRGSPSKRRRDTSDPEDV